MKKIYTAYFIIFILSSCSVSKIDYVGSNNPPTQKIDVYVDEKTINRQFVIVGKGYPLPDWRGHYKQEKILKEAIVKAQKNGADAIFYKETFIPTPGTNISTFSKTDSSGTGSITNSNTAISPTYGYFHKEILFLKYK